MATPIFYAGFYGTAAIGANELAVTRWDVTPIVQTQEFKNSMSGPAVVRQPTFQDVSGTLDLDYDFANDPFASPPAIIVGSILTNLALYLHQSAKNALDGKKWVFPSIIIESTPMSLTVDGKVTVRVSFKGAGTNTAAAAATYVAATLP